MIKWKPTTTGILHIAVAVVASILLIALNVVRIFRIPITMDETGFYLSNHSYLDLAENKMGTANDHILHSLIRKFLVDTFNDSLFFIRLDSLMAQILYLFFTYRLCRLVMKNTWWQLGGFLILNISSPFLFNFWGLSRGYGLSVAFMLMSIYWLSAYIIRPRLFLLALSSGAAMLSVYSNFSLLNYFVALLAVIGIQHILFRKSLAPGRKLFREFALLCISTLLLALMVVEPVTNVYHHGDLCYMGSKGFIDDTIMSLISCGFYIRTPEYIALITVIAWSVITTTIFGGSYWLFILCKKRNQKDSIDATTQVGATLFLLLLIPVLSIIAQHALLGINYVTDRGALFLLPLFLVFFIYLLYSLNRENSFVCYLSSGIFTCIFLILSYNFCSKTNISSALLSWYNAGDLAMLQRIMRESENGQSKIKLKASWLFPLTLNYDVDHYYKGHFYPVEHISAKPLKDTSCDYYYIAMEDISNLPPGYVRDTDFLSNAFFLFRKDRANPSSVAK